MSSRKRYDYRREVATDPAELDDKLAQHGGNGWELVTVVFDGSRYVAFLKRKTKLGRHSGDKTASERD